MPETEFIPNPYNRTLRKFNKRQDISEENKKEINLFIHDRLACGISEQRASRILSAFSCILTNFTPPGFKLKQATEEQLKETVGKINTNKRYAEETKASMKIILKTYYKVLNNGDIPQRAKFITTSLKAKDSKLPEDLISIEEKDAIIQACNNTRDKAIISVLYESGFRISELGNMKIKNLVFNNDSIGVIAIAPQGKTGARRLLLIDSEARLRQYLEEHPENSKPDAPLWVELDKKQGSARMVKYAAIRTMLWKKAKKANLNPKKFNPHNFRHTAATDKSQWMTETQLCEWFGWILGSDMPRKYIHRSGKNLDNVILARHGLEENKDIKAPVKCLRCGTLNAASLHSCRKCLAPLDASAYLPGDKDASIIDGMLSLFLELLESRKKTLEGKTEIKNLLEKYPTIKEELAKVKQNQRV